MILRDLKPEDEATWRDLWLGYLAFYEQSLAADVTRATWHRLLDPPRLFSSALLRERAAYFLDSVTARCTKEPGRQRRFAISKTYSLGHSPTAAGPVVP